jgi:predicted DNA-binding protein
MPKSTTVKLRISADQKARVKSVCRQKGITESAFVRQVMEKVAKGARDIPCASDAPTGRFRRSCRVSVRLRPDDGLLLRERARRHKLSTSAHAARLVSDPVQAQLPLPTTELQALRTSIDEVNTLGRALNDVARALQRGERVRGPTNGDLKALFAALVRLRDRVRVLADTNRRSWLSPRELNK